MFVSSEELHYVIILSSYTTEIGKFCRNHYFIYKVRNSGEETVCRARRIITHQTQFFSYGGRSTNICCVQSKHIRFQPSLFTVIPFDTWQFGKICVWVNFIIQKLKSKHLVCSTVSLSQFSLVTSFFEGKRENILHIFRA